VTPPRAASVPLARVREWRSRSISNQITFGAVTLTLAVAAGIGFPTFFAVRSLMARNIGSALESQATLVAQRLATDLGEVARDVAELAQNSFVANGLVDSLGRDTYLLPFIREHRHDEELRAGVVLCNFKGRPIASNEPSAEGLIGRIAGVRLALTTAKPFVEIVEEGGGAQLVFSHPVIFPPTGQVEGVIVERIDLSGMLTSATAFLSPQETAHLKIGGFTVAPAGRLRGRTEASVTVRPRLPAQLAEMDASLEVGTREAIYAPLRWVAVAYLLTGMAIAVVVVRASRRMARRLAGPIEALSRTASEVAAGGEPEVSGSEHGAAEVRALTAAIAAMLGKLRAANEELEERVRDRTSELQRRERELARYAETQAVLLREVNHRVKNNLSAIISVLHLEEARAGEDAQPKLVEILGEMESRVRSLATVHALLSGAEWQPIPLGDLCRKLLRSSLGSADGSGLELRADGPPIAIESGQAHHLALALNELATNTLKYGRVGGAPSRAEVIVRSDERGVELTFRDHGPGFPAAVLGGAPGAIGTGLQLVRGIVETSLGGELSLSNDGGAVASIRFVACPPPAEGAGT
jgi:two-component sensor histidine kinase/HAMP domain-containing protein